MQDQNLETKIAVLTYCPCSTDTKYFKRINHQESMGQGIHEWTK